MPNLIEPISIVIVGGWNPAILQPSWLMRHVFDVPEGETEEVQMAFSPVPGAPPRFTVHELTFVASDDRLMLQINEPSDDNLNLMESKGLRIVEKLPHTPIRAIGQNFLFQIENPSAATLDVFDVRDNLYDRVEYQELASTSIVSSLALDDSVLNLTRTFLDGVVRVKLNFHVETGSVADSKTALTSKLLNHWQIATQVAESYE